MSYEWESPTQYPSSSLLIESQPGAAFSSVQWNVGTSPWARHSFLLPPKDRAPRKEALSVYYPFALCPSFSFLLEGGLDAWRQCSRLETTRIEATHWMGRRKMLESLGIWVGTGLPNSGLLLCLFKLLFVECSVPCSCLPSWLMYYSYIAFVFPLVAQTVKRLPTMWETWVQSLGRQDLLEKEMVTHSSTLAWKIPWTEEPGRL